MSFSPSIVYCVAFAEGKAVSRQTPKSMLRPLLSIGPRGAWHQAAVLENYHSDDPPPLI
jgi:hypothetical protein